MKILWKRVLLAVMPFLVMLAISGCASNATPGDGTGITGNTPTAAPTTGSGSGAVVKTATAMVDGQSKTILTDANGMTLYYFTPDTATKTACTGACAQTWPPLLFQGSGKVTSATQLPGELEAYQNDNGNQVLYNDHFLYTYSVDTAPGDTKGQDVGGKWYVATPDLAKLK
jgi:predicted lipoprotein with Yx(FWY)xxD motif